MILRQLFQVSREELQKARRAILAAYEIMREADERALASLLMFLGLR